MSSMPSPWSRSAAAAAAATSTTAVVGRLRAAGCVFAEDEAELLLSAAPTAAALDALTGRRVAGEPLEYVLGWAEFRGLRIAVDPGVFVPRRRTEFLVRQAVALGHQMERPVVLDLCCGTGAVGAALVTALERVELHAADTAAAAVRCARRNLPADARVYEGDLYEPLPASLRGRVGLLAANVPYVPTGDIRLLPPEAREYEPHVALDGGADGLDVLRRVAADAAGWLAPGGCLLVETDERQVVAVREAFRRGGLGARVKRSDELEAAVVIGVRPPAAPPRRPPRR